MPTVLVAIRQSALPLPGCTMPVFARIPTPAFPIFPSADFPSPPIVDKVAPPKDFIPAKMPGKLMPFGPAMPDRICFATPPAFTNPLPMAVLPSALIALPTPVTYFPGPEFFSRPSTPPFVLASRTSFTKPVCPFLVPLRSPLKFFIVAQMPTPAPSNVCPILPRRVAGCCAPMPAICAPYFAFSANIPAFDPANAAPLTVFWIRLVGVNAPNRFLTVMPPKVPPGAPLGFPPITMFPTVDSSALPALYAACARLMAPSAATMAVMAPATSGPCSAV